MDLAGVDLLDGMMKDDELYQETSLWIAANIHKG